MKQKIRRHKNLFIIVGTIFAISIVLNIAMVIKVHKYKYKVGTESYNYIEKIKTLNKGSLDIISSAIDIGSIENMEILKLYENYSDISDNNINLWNEYLYYQDDKHLITHKKQVNTDESILNNVDEKIALFFTSILEEEMKTQNYKLVLNGELLEEFIEIQNLCKEIEQYYNDFCEERLNGAVQEEKKDKIISKYYWIDMLEGINDINKKYVDVEFKL
ncbi:MAG: hypothetical protein E7214_03115 [Clostridium sp.]|nr:hypothetical protein [Clostridium sp.]